MDVAATLGTMPREGAQPSRDEAHLTRQRVRDFFHVNDARLPCRHLGRFCGTLPSDEVAAVGLRWELHARGPMEDTSLSPSIQINDRRLPAMTATAVPIDWLGAQQGCS